LIKNEPEPVNLCKPHTPDDVLSAFEGMANDIEKFLARKKALQTQGLPNDEIIAILNREREMDK